ncbi:hypothetical protein BHYA_0047g00480 [Botrytis hyacinthi]|uniref:Uncharacterized protein n=1 Tax=Botrytis hyacinthi TaxID=278943 RepID=A0A4Z1GSH2_9HELO|nr:hypothetical protein BHYA_0047g00480 [Botrytis hyacinthi]
MQTCKEAYDEGIQLQFSHFTFCNYGLWGDKNCHAQLPKHYMNPDTDIMWLVDNSECELPTSLALYEERPTYRMVKIFAINHQLWHDPRPQWDGNVMSWTLGTLAFLPYQMCEEIYVVLSDVSLDLNFGVTFVEPVDGHDETLSSRKFTSQGREESNSVLFKEAERRKKNLEDFRKHLSKFEDDYHENINEHTWFKYLPIIRYVIAKPGETLSLYTCIKIAWPGTTPLFTYIKNQKPKVVGHKSLTPLNTVSLPDHLKSLVSNNDDDSWFPEGNGTDDYTSENAEEDVYEDDLEYDSHAGDEDVEDEEDDEGDDREEAEAESENLGTSTSSNADSEHRVFRTLPFNSAVEVLDFQDYAAFTNNGDGTGHNQMSPPDEDDTDL